METAPTDNGAGAGGGAGGGGGGEVAISLEGNNNGSGDPSGGGTGIGGGIDGNNSGTNADHNNGGSNSDTAAVESDVCAGDSGANVGKSCEGALLRLLKHESQGVSREAIRGLSNLLTSFNHHEQTIR
jgi:hypothetical protein